MLKILKVDGKTKSQAGCDECLTGFEWEANISLSRMEYLLRQKGWSVGKKHICQNCKDKKRPPTLAGVKRYYKGTSKADAHGCVD